MNFKIFGRWDVTGIQVSDFGLKKYVNLDAKLVPRSSGKNIGIKFHKSKNNIVERLMNKMMVPGHKGKKHRLTSYHATGKAVTNYNSVEKVFEIIEKKTGKNPVEVFVKALENAAPREEITNIEYGGAKYPQSVDVAPQRRVDIALRQFVQGAYGKSFGTKKKIVDCLVDEIIGAYNLDQKSAAIAKKLELERQADSAR